MQIRVKCKCGEGKCSEWAIVELQGTVEAHLTFQDRLQNLEIGVLCRPSSQVFSFFLKENLSFPIDTRKISYFDLLLKKYSDVGFVLFFLIRFRRCILLLLGIMN